MQSSSQVTCLCVCVLALGLFTSLCGDALLGFFLLKQRVCLGYLQKEVWGRLGQLKISPLVV